MNNVFIRIPLRIDILLQVAARASESIAYYEDGHREQFKSS